MTSLHIAYSTGGLHVIEAASMPESSWCWRGNSIELFARAQDFGLPGLPEAVYSKREAGHELSVLFTLQQQPKVQPLIMFNYFLFFIFYLDQYYINLYIAWGPYYFNVKISSLFSKQLSEWQRTWSASTVWNYILLLLIMEIGWLCVSQHGMTALGWAGVHMLACYPTSLIVSWNGGDILARGGLCLRGTDANFNFTKLI